MLYFVIVINNYYFCEKDFMLNITIILFIFTLIAFVIHIAYYPALDITRDGKVLLWYGRKERKFIVLRD